MNNFSNIMNLCVAFRGQKYYNEGHIQKRICKKESEGEEKCVNT